MQLSGMSIKVLNIKGPPRTSLLSMHLLFCLLLQTTLKQTGRCFTSPYCTPQNPHCIKLGSWLHCCLHWLASKAAGLLADTFFTLWCTTDLRTFFWDWIFSLPVLPSSLMAELSFCPSSEIISTCSLIFTCFPGTRVDPAFKVSDITDAQHVETLVSWLTVSQRVSFFNIVAESCLGFGKTFSLRTNLAEWSSSELKGIFSVLPCFTVFLPSSGSQTKKN